MQRVQLLPCILHAGDRGGYKSKQLFFFVDETRLDYIADAVVGPNWPIGTASRSMDKLKLSLCRRSSAVHFFEPRPEVRTVYCSREAEHQSFTMDAKSRLLFGHMIKGHMRKQALLIVRISPPARERTHQRTAVQQKISNSETKRPVTTRCLLYRPLDDDKYRRVCRCRQSLYSSRFHLSH